MAPIPEKQTAVWVDKPSKDANIYLRHDVPVPTPGDDEVLVQIECSGLCHSDVYNMAGSHPMDVHIPGHEGVGTVVQLGKRVVESGVLGVGRRVGIKWINETCGACEICARNETSCPKQHNSGRDRPGTLQQFVCVPARHASPIPDGLRSELAAPLLCAGLTLYSAIGKSQTRKGDWIVIQGAGGGLGHLGIQIATRRGLSVIAIDGEDKRELCQTLGASAFFDFRDPELEDKIRSLTSFGAHAVVSSAGSEAGYNLAIKLLRGGGTLVCVGLPGNLSYCLPIGPMQMVVRGLTIVGSAVGTEDEMQELLEMARKGEVVAHVNALPLARFKEALEQVKASKTTGRIVLQMPGYDLEN